MSFCKTSAFCCDWGMLLYKCKIRSVNRGSVFKLSKCTHIKLKVLSAFLYGKCLLVLENTTTFVKNFQYSNSAPFVACVQQNAA